MRGRLRGCLGNERRGTSSCCHCSQHWLVSVHHACVAAHGSSSHVSCSLRSRARSWLVWAPSTLVLEGGREGGRGGGEHAQVRVPVTTQSVRRFVLRCLAASQPKRLDMSPAHAGVFLVFACAATPRGRLRQATVRRGAFSLSVLAAARERLLIPLSCCVTTQHTS